MKAEVNLGNSRLRYKSRYTTLNDKKMRLGQRYLMIYWKNSMNECLSKKDSGIVKQVGDENEQNLKEEFWKCFATLA